MSGAQATYTAREWAAIIDAARAAANRLNYFMKCHERHPMTGAEEVLYNSVVLRWGANRVHFTMQDPISRILENTALWTSISNDFRDFRRERRREIYKIATAIAAETDGENYEIHQNATADTDTTSASPRPPSA